jgi:hypothetical protein
MDLLRRAYQTPDAVCIHHTSRSCHDRLRRFRAHTFRQYWMTRSPRGRTGQRSSIQRVLDISNIPTDEKRGTSLKDLWRNSGREKSASERWARRGRMLSHLFQYPQFIEALVDLQKAQVFFMLTVQVVALLALAYPSLFEATSYAQLLATTDFLYLAALNGCFPIVLLGSILRAAEQNSLYTATGSRHCVTVSAVTFILTNKDPFSPADIVADGPYVPECGG